MDKREFLARLREGLAGLPPEDAEERLTFYGEMIDDRVEEGLSEEDAVAGIGSPGAVALRILAEARSDEAADPSARREEPAPEAAPAPKAERRRRSPGVWEIVLLVLGFPLWFPLLIAAFAVVLSVYVVIWAVIVSVWAVDLSCVIGAVGCIAGLFFLLFRGTVVRRLAALAAGLVLAGVSVLLFFVCRAATRGAFFLTKKAAAGLLSPFRGKE